MIIPKAAIAFLLAFQGSLAIGVVAGTSRAQLVPATTPIAIEPLSKQISLTAKNKAIIGLSSPY